MTRTTGEGSLCLFDSDGGGSIDDKGIGLSGEVLRDLSGSLTPSKANGLGFSLALVMVCRNERHSEWNGDSHRVETMRRHSVLALQGDLFGEEPCSGNGSDTGRRVPRRTANDREGARTPSLLSDEEMARHLEESGNYRVLRKLVPRPVRPRLLGSVERIGIILDTETTGLDPAKDEIIELGMIAFTYDETCIRDVIDIFSALREPSVPISPEITRITSITPEMVEGESIDLEAVQRFIEPADLIIAHNARFDRPFCERFAPGFDVKPWACSVSEVDWSGLGFEGTKLGYLVGQSGYFHNGHRAVDDCHALLEVLASSPKPDTDGPFRQLLASSARTRLRLYAIGSPFHTKDLLKARGYRWSDGSDGRPKCWWCEIAEGAQEEEERFLREEIYQADIDLHVQRLTACERFKA